MTGAGSHAARGGRIHRAVCGTPARIALTELLELTARVSWLQEHGTKPRQISQAQAKPHWQEHLVVAPLWKA